MQTLIINNQKITINRSLTIMDKDCSRELVQLGSGAWMWGKAIPHAYVKDISELDGVAIPSDMKEDIVQWLRICKENPEVMNPKQTLTGINDGRNPSAIELMGQVMSQMDPSEQAALVNVVSGFMKQTLESRMQRPLTNSHEGYGQDSEIPVYDPSAPSKGHYLRYKNPLGSSDQEISEDDKEAFRQYQIQLDSQKEVRGATGLDEVQKPLGKKGKGQGSDGIEAELSKSR